MRSTHLARRAVALAGVLLGTLAVVVLPPASAQASDDCTTRTTTKAFSAFGDTNDYFTISGGTFESGDLSPFTLTASPWIAAENEPWRVFGPADARSLALPAGATLTARFCVQVGEDSMRIFAKSPGVGGSLKIKATVSTAYGSASASTSTGSSTPGWAPTGRLGLTNVSGPDGRQYVTLVITNAGTGTWLVDDIAVDPWRTL
ncbi:MAG: hypothetical protein H0X35_14130 [Pseudonocardiales bacterium]|nr:hypothetical protein [Pseudonocardiales bacterium]